MSIKGVSNPRCGDGMFCTSRNGIVRRVPFPRGRSMVLCHACWKHVTDYWLQTPGYPIPEWKDLEIVKE